MGLPTRFTGASVSSFRVDRSCRKLHLILAGADGGSEVSSDVYHAHCLANSAFKGFSFIVMTAVEDKVGAVAVPSDLLKYRLVLYKPADHLDFALCLLIAYLENSPRDVQCSSLFVQVRVFLQFVWSRVTPMTKLRRLLCVTATWLLNTLMYLSDHTPFDSTRVLPHHMIHKHLSKAPSLPPVLEAMYEVGGDVTKRGDVDKADDSAGGNRRKGTTILKRGLLNGAFRPEWVSEALYEWWGAAGSKLSGDCLFYRYD
uniref:UL7-like protein n=1 Tax=Anatid alphaherpesvirus 2 TaxID=3080522 RepID=A0AAU0K693_9ALPH